MHNYSHRFQGAFKVKSFASFLRKYEIRLQKKQMQTVATQLAVDFCEFEAIKLSQSREIHRRTRKRQGCTRNRHTSGRGSPPDRSTRLCVCGTFWSADLYNEHLNLCGGESFMTGLPQATSCDTRLIIST